MATAADRFKRILADAFERICVLEEQLELAQARIRELEGETDEAGTDRPRTTD